MITATLHEHYNTDSVYQFPYLNGNCLFSIGAKTTAGTEIYISTIIPPHVMTTKNNLDTAVTKTSGQTMKVTYVLTEV